MSNMTESHGLFSISTRRLTLFGRSTVLIFGVILANVLCWVIAGLTFSQTDGLVNLAFLAWASFPKIPRALVRLIIRH
jgi:hypothetical protein